LNSSLHNLHHLLSDESLVGVLGIAGSFDLLSGFLGEGEGEKSEAVTIGGFALNESLDERMPFFHHGACLISGDIHTIEVGIAVHSFDFVNLEFKLSPGLGLSLVVAVSQGDANNTTSKTISSHFLTSVFVTWGQSDVSLIETWGKYVVPLFSGERVNDSLLSALLFETFWVLTGCHWISSGFYKGGIPS